MATLSDRGSLRVFKATPSVTTATRVLQVTGCLEGCSPRKCCGPVWSESSNHCCPTPNANETSSGGRAQVRTLVTQKRERRKVARTMTRVKSSRCLCSSWNSSMSPVITDSIPPICRRHRAEERWGRGRRSAPRLGRHSGNATDVHSQELHGVRGAECTLGTGCSGDVATGEGGPG